jgi:replicative DNA helicase
MVIFIYRPEYYENFTNENGESTKGETHIKIAKHRNGSLDTVKLRARLEIQKFYDWDGDDTMGFGGGGGNFRPVGPQGGGGGNGFGDANAGGGKFFVQGSKMNTGDFDAGFDNSDPF